MVELFLAISWLILIEVVSWFNLELLHQINLFAEKRPKLQLSKSFKDLGFVQVTTLSNFSKKEKMYFLCETVFASATELQKCG